VSDHSVTTQQFVRVAGGVLEALLEAEPERATELGEHRFDDRLTDLSAAGIQQRCGVLTDALAALDELDDVGLSGADQVDLEILRTRVAHQLWATGELRPHETDPLLHLPGDGLYPLLARPGADPAERLRALTARLQAVPERLATAREVLHDMPAVQVETAVTRTRGTVGLLAELDPLISRVPALAGPAGQARQLAADALEQHARWLEEQLPEAAGDPRLGGESYAAKLWYELDTQISPDNLLTRAESELQATEEEIAELAARIEGRPNRPGQVREVLDRLAAQAPADDASILPLCRQAMAEATARVCELDLVEVPDDPVDIIVMPESMRGVAVAYCDAPGPLEPPPRPATFFAVAPTPADWSADRVASFYREYNGHLVRNLTVHEAMPGHVLQLAHAARYRGNTAIRAAASSGPFVEGWAVYAESVLAEAGWGAGEELDGALRMQRLKVLIRSTINAILDVRVHTRGMTRDEAMALMTGRGHQEEGEAAGKWRRALLTSAQLSTYFVGYHEVRSLVGLLRQSRPGSSDRELHDLVLSHGSPPPRHLAALLAG
jgi:uncharacterized protein (DUF885 family)